MPHPAASTSVPQAWQSPPSTAAAGCLHAGRRELFGLAERGS
jgi:hypothetical protein